MSWSLRPSNLSTLVIRCFRELSQSSSRGIGIGSLLRNHRVCLCNDTAASSRLQSSTVGIGLAGPWMRKAEDATTTAIAMSASAASVKSDGATNTRQDFQLFAVLGLAFRRWFIMALR